GHVLYLPVYRGAVQPATIEERRETLAGFVFASFRTDQLWSAMLPSVGPDALVDFEIFENNAAGKLVFDAYPNRPPGTVHGAHTSVAETPLRYFGQRWTLRVTTLEAFERDT